jgi:hypothetical protein
MRLLRAKALILAAAGGAIAVLLNGGSALAGTQLTSRTVTGPEVISGAVFGAAANVNQPRIPLYLRGVVNTTDPNFVLTDSASKHHTLFTRAGQLRVLVTGNEQDTQSLNYKICHATFTARATLTVLGGTRAFAGASGPGAYQVRFAAFFPRYTSGKRKGQCNFSSKAKPLNRGAVASFLATAVLTVRS